MPILAPSITKQPSTAVMLDMIEQVLRERGWSRGRRIGRGGRLSLEAAVDEAAARIVTGERARVVLAARTKNLLGRCAGIGSLAAWNDARRRRVEDVHELLAVARFTGI